MVSDYFGCGVDNVLEIEAKLHNLLSLLKTIDLHTLNR